MGNTALWRHITVFFSRAEKPSEDITRGLFSDEYERVTHWEETIKRNINRKLCKMKIVLRHRNIIFLDHKFFCRWNNFKLSSWRIPVRKTKAEFFYAWKLQKRPGRTWQNKKYLVWKVLYKERQQTSFTRHLLTLLFVFLFYGPTIFSCKGNLEYFETFCT